MHLRLIIALALLLAAGSPAFAQTTPGKAAAIRELLEVGQTRETFLRGMELGMAEQMEEMTPTVRAALRSFMDEHFRYEDLEPGFIAMYDALFTEEEIRGITAFYRTPAGRRMVELSPEVAVASQRIANERLQRVMPLLIDAITAAMAAEP
jgi:uncharacterized protein